MSPFDTRVVAYNPGGSRIGPIDVLTLNVTIAFSDAPMFSARVTEAVLESLPDIVEMAVEYWHPDLDLWVEPDDARFLAKEGEGDDKDPAGVRTLTGVGLWHWMLSKNVIAVSESGADPAYPDGHRPFVDALPGAIIKTLLDEAHTRGWGAFLDFDFTHSADSQGVPWAEAYTIAYKPGISVWMALANLADQAIVEFSTTGRTLHLYRPDHGLDLSEGAAPVRIGNAATNMPVKTSIDDLITHVTVFGENAMVWEFNEGATNVLGRLEGSIQQGGVSRPGTAAKMAASTLQNGSQIKRQITATENSLTTPSLPFIHYNTGDWVLARVNDANESLRVMEIQIRKEKTITIDTILNDRFIDLLARTAKRANGILGGTNAGGSGVPPVYDDRRVPKTPIGVVATSEGYWTPDGVAQSSLAVRWVATTQGTDNIDIVINAYELWYRKQSETPDRSVLLGTVGSASFGSNPYEPDAKYYIKVRAVSEKGVYGAFTAEQPITMEGPIDPLPAPTAPVLTSSLGVIRVKWDGYLQEGGTTFTLTGQFKHTYAVMSVSEDGVYFPVGQAFERAGTGIVGNVVMGETYWFKLYAVDNRNVESLASPPASIMVVGVSLPDIDQAIKDAIDGATTAANQAVASANGKNSLFHSTTGPVGPGTRVGDLWHEWSSMGVDGRLLATWRWGTEWTQVTLDETYIPLLDIGSGTYGSMNGDRLTANSINVDKLVVADTANMVTINETTPNSADTPGTEHIIENGWSTRADSNVSEFMLRPNAGPLPFKTGDHLRVTLTGYADANAEATLGLGLGDGEQWQSLAGVPFTTAEKDFDFEATVTVDTAGMSTFRIGFYGVYGLKISLRNVRVYRMNAGELIVDGAISARALRSEEIWADEAWIGDATANLLTVGAIKAGMIEANAVGANSIAANAITAKHTITGALIRTAASGARTEMSVSGLRVLDAANTELVKLGFGSATGMSIRHKPTGRMVELSQAVFGAGSIVGGSAAGAPGPYGVNYGGTATHTMLATLVSPFEYSMTMLMLGEATVSLPSNCMAEVTFVTTLNGVTIGSSVQECFSPGVAMTQKIGFTTRLSMGPDQAYAFKYVIRAKQSGAAAVGSGSATVFGGSVVSMPLFSDF